MADKETKLNEYEPTTAEEKLLQVLANPENIGLTITDICNLADVSRKTYYEAFKKPEFVALHDKLCKDLVKQSLTPIVNAFITEAKKGSYNHGKILLEMGGLYTNKQEIDNINTNINNDVSNLSPEERRARINELIAKRGR